MKRFYSKFRIALMTFALGLASVFVMNGSLQFSDEVLVDLPKTDSEEILVVFPQYSDEIPNSGSGSGGGYENDPWKLPENFRPLEKGEFFPVFHACGNGYIGGYLAYDDSRLSAGFTPMNSSDLNKEIESAEKIIERVKNYKNKDGERGLRIILQGRNEDTGKEYYQIIWFGKSGERVKGMEYLVGPSLEITLEFEKYLNK